MDAVQRLRPRRLTTGALAIAGLFFAGVPAFAQAWVPPAGVGSITISFQRIDNTGHLLTDGSSAGGLSENLSLLVEVDYAITDRLSISAGLPYVGARWTDPNPPPPFVPFLPVDQCHCWHGGLQDFAFTARYNVIRNGGFALTPSLSVGAPSHDYAYQGEAVIGRDLKELRFGVDVGQRLDRISPRLSVQGRYSYAVVEQVLDIPNNRSNATVEGAFQLTRKFDARGFATWQRTHGGLRFGGMGELPPPGEVNTPELLAQHDRLLRDNNFRVGGGVSYSLPTIDLFASYISYVSGTDSHLGRAFTFGISWPFEIAR